MTPEPVYRYVAHVLNVVDGDTVDLEVQLGMHQFTRDRFRLYGINAPERSEAVIGKAATDHLKSLLPVGSMVIVDTKKDKKEKYGRWLAVIYPGETGVSVNDQMVIDGHAIHKDY